MLTTAERIDDQIAHPGTYKILDIKVLKAHAQIPVNVQAGPDCGIYALNAALQIRGKAFAPRNIDRDETTADAPSLRWAAKHDPNPISKIGEISSAVDLAKLSSWFGIVAEVQRFGSPEELWDRIRNAVAANRAVVLPYSCQGDDGAPAWSRHSSGFTHWCLLFGHVTYSSVSKPRVFLTTYGYYHEVAPYELFKSNQRIQDWPGQNWVKVVLWFKPPGKDWEIWKTDWRAESTLQKSLKETASATGRGIGFGIGDKTQVMHKFVDPENGNNLDIAPALLKKLQIKEAYIESAEYSRTLSGQAVVV